MSSGDPVDPATDLVYVSWGGTGRGATLRKALLSAAESDRGLLYLAILDDSAFADLDESSLVLTKDELSWLLDAQLELTKRQADLEEVPVRVVIRAGDVADSITEVVESVGPTDVLIGAPVPLTDHATVAELVDHLSTRVGRPVTIVDP